VSLDATERHLESRARLYLVAWVDEMSISESMKEEQYQIKGLMSSRLVHGRTFYPDGAPKPGQVKQKSCPNNGPINSKIIQF